MRQVVKHKTDVFTFGKFKGKTVRHVLENDPSYIIWLHEEKIVEFPQSILDNAEDMVWEEKNDMIGRGWDGAEAD